eukprot:GHVU01109126.1.p1 GENE.GHVU01109126.1~~GHVU01109126.1.p1  ORF type:complete len:599 (+),score=113.17 GHVU01109126.1:201-1997(+)
MMAALQPRHRWLACQLAATFGTEGDACQFEESLRENPNFSKLEKFLDGSSGEAHLFLFSYKNKLKTSGNGLQLLCTDGRSAPLEGKALYLLRCIPAGKAVNLQVHNDADLLCGDTSPDLLATFASSFATIFAPLLRRSNEIEWGQCSTEQRDEFLSKALKFSADLTSAATAESQGIDLRRVPDEVDMKSISRDPVKALSPMVLVKLEGLVEEWCKGIERVLKKLDSGAGAAGTENESMHISRGAGPRQEIEYWRSKTQKLASISEQLRAPECSDVINVLQTASKLEDSHIGKSRQSIVCTLRSWKQQKSRVDDCLTEAKDNVKYLATVEPFLEPLYRDKPEELAKKLPALLNSVKMVYTISKFYNTELRVGAFLSKVSHQLINSCKSSILEGASLETLWDNDYDQLLKRLRGCLHLYDAYKAQCNAEKEKSASNPSGKQFSFQDSSIFGSFDLFRRRIHKLVDMFSTMKQFQTLSRHRFDGLEKVVEAFKEIRKDFRSKRHDLLDYHDSRFDRDHVEFNVRITGLEQILEAFMNQAVESRPSIAESLSLLEKFKEIFTRENLQANIEDKVCNILLTYGAELNSVGGSLIHSPLQPVSH